MVFVASVTATVAALVVWVVYVLGSVGRISELASGFGLRSANTHWVVLAVGVLLLALLIVGLSVLLAQALAEQRWARDQDEFVSNITHELKSPLAAIKLHAQSLEQGDLGADESRSVGYILKEVERMAVLVDNVLESSRLAAPRRPAAALSPLEVTGFFRDWVEDARIRVEGNGLELITEAPDHELWIAATRERLVRILDNLVENAVRFSKREGQVRCSVIGTPAVVRFEVEDDGIGIPKSELALIFERFYQIGKEISQRRGGTGLGLSIVSGLVDELRGTVHAFSQEGRPGARFVVEVPRLERGP